MEVEGGGYGGKLVRGEDGGGGKLVRREGKLRENN